MKALRNRLRVEIVVQVVALGLLCGLAACSGQQGKPDDPLVEQSDAKTDDEILFAAVLDVFAEQGLDVELDAPERGIALTSWREVNREVRHRYEARVIRSNVGLVLTVDSKYERREFSGAETQWVDADDPYTVETKQREEARMGAAIQKRFKALGGGK